MAAMRQARVVLLLTLLGLVVGVGLGLAVGWLWWPVEYIDTETADLKEAYKTDYVLMVSDAYVLTGDLDAARERLGHLGGSDIPTLLRAQAEAALASGASRAEMSRLAQLAAAFGVSSPVLGPYLTPVPSEP
jgi:hypothetical protein